MLAMLAARDAAARGCAWLRSRAQRRAFHAGRLVPGLIEPHPRENDAGMGPADLSGNEKDQIMATKTAQKTTAKPAPRTAASRPAITLALVTAHAPTEVHAEKMSAAFALDPVDYHGIREATEEHIGLSAKVLQPTVNDIAMRIHLQRVVGSFISSAHGAANFYQNKVSDARTLTAKLANNDRDEDREAVWGFESKAARARQFAAEAGLTAYALRAAAEGGGACLRRHHRRGLEALRAAAGRARLGQPPVGRSRDGRLRVRQPGRGSHGPRLAPRRHPAAAAADQEAPQVKPRRHSSARNIGARSAGRKSISTDLPLSRRPTSGRFNPAFGAARSRVALACNLRQGWAAPVADPKWSAPVAPRPRPVACLRG